MRPALRVVRIPRGFSLAEITMAMAFTTFALVGILGLLPMGLLAARQAVDNSIESQIMRQINGQLLVTPFAGIDDYANESPFFYDDAGTLMGTDPTLLAPSSYVVTLTPTNHAQLTFPTANSTISQSLRTLRVQIATKPVGSAFATATNHFTLNIPNSGK